MKTFKEFTEKWSGPTRDGTYTHTSGAKVIIAGPQGRHYAWYANGRRVKTSGGRNTSFKHLADAQKKALER